MIAMTACISICKAQNTQNTLGNSNTQMSPKVNTPSSNTSQPIYNDNKPQYGPNQNTMYNNNSQQYNKGNTIKNSVPEGNGNSYTPGAQGTNNINNPATNSNNVPGTINNTNGTYTQPTK